MPYSVKKNGDGKFCVHWGDTEVKCYDSQAAAEDAMAEMPEDGPDMMEDAVAGPLGRLRAHFRDVVLTTLADLGLAQRPARPPEVVAADDEEARTQALLLDLQQRATARIERALSVQNIWEQCWSAALDDDDAWWTPLEMFVEDNQLFAIFGMGGKLYKRALDVQDDILTVGEPIEVMQKFEERVTTAGQAGKTIIRRQQDGRVRWFSISSTNVLNRSGQIDAGELFDSFEAHAKATGEYPIRMFWHQGEHLRTGQADGVWRDGNTYITTGLYDEDNFMARIEIAAREAEPDRYGESIGFMPTHAPIMEQIAEGVYVPVFRQGVNYEISTLPEHLAAALYTCTTQEGNMRKEVVDELRRMAAVAGAADEVEDFIAQVDGVNHTIEQQDLIRRQGAVPLGTPTEDLVSPAETAPEVTPDDTVIELDEAVLDALVARVLASPVLAQRFVTQIDEALAPMRAALAALDARFEELRQVVEDDLVESEEQPLPALPVASAPASRRVTLSYRPRVARSDPADNTLVGFDRLAAQTLAQAPLGR